MYGTAQYDRETLAIPRLPRPRLIRGRSGCETPGRKLFPTWTPRRRRRDWWQRSQNALGMSLAKGLTKQKINLLQSLVNFTVPDLADTQAWQIDADLNS